MINRAIPRLTLSRELLEQLQLFKSLAGILGGEKCRDPIYISIPGKGITSGLGIGAILFLTKTFVLFFQRATNLQGVVGGSQMGGGFSRC
jgi:hypothetical protein